MNNAPSPIHNRRFSILSFFILIMMGLCAGVALLAVAGFLGLLFIIMLYLGANLVMAVVGAMILILAGG